MTASAEELYFESRLNVMENDRFVDERSFLIGNTVTITGTSFWYDESTNENIPVPGTEFHVIVKDHDLKTVLEGVFISDRKCNMDISFPLTEDHRFGKYRVEAMVKSNDRQRHFDRSFTVGPSAEEIVPAPSSFQFWLEDPPAADFSRVKLTGVVCSEKMHKQNWDESVFALPVNGYAVETRAVHLFANFTDPGGRGNFYTSVSGLDKDACTGFSMPILPTDVPGKWSVRVNAWWMEGGILYEAQSDAFAFDVRAPIFYNDAVEEIPLDFFSIRSNHP